MRKARGLLRELFARREPRAFCLLRDATALVLASALALLPLVAVHSMAEAHPLDMLSSAKAVDESGADDAGGTEGNGGGGGAADGGDGSEGGASDTDANGGDSGSGAGSGIGSGAEVAEVAEVAPVALPNSYYLTNAGFATSVKLQNPWGACWAFAIASAIESSILVAQAQADGTYDTHVAEGADTAPKLSGLTDSIDISERAIAWLSHELQTNASAGEQAGEGLYRVDGNDYATQLAGGNFPIVEAALAARQSLVLESTAPYQYNGYERGRTPWFSTPSFGGVDARTFDWSLNDDLRIANDVGWYVSGIVELPSPAVGETKGGSGSYEYKGYDASATRSIKEALVRVGAVAISLQAETSLPGELRQSDSFDYGTWSQYDSASDIYTNHAVTIVGWDDSYSRGNFGGTVSGQPPADGAWLCKNNWGSDALYAALGGRSYATHWGVEDGNGASGFFWLSYYDHTITSPVAFEVAPVEEDGTTLYQYDYLGMSEYSEPASYEGAVRVANMFTAQETELLTQVTAQTFRQDEQVECWVYVMPQEGSDGWLASQAEETFAEAGFHTLTLEHPALIAAGQRFLVVERVHSNIAVDGKPVDASYLNLELAFAEAPTGDAVETMAQVVANPGETYVALDGEDDAWMTLEQLNDWYQEARVEAGGADVTYGNALVKAMTAPTSMGSGSQVYELVKLS